jgi:hypothetical protein
MARIIIAVAVLVVLGLVAFLVFHDDTVEEERQQIVEILPAVDLDQLDRIEVNRHEGSGDSLREEAIVLAKTGDEWRMLEPVDYAINPRSIERMEEALGGLRVIDAIAENKKKHHVLEVDDELGVEVKAKAGDETLAHFIVGVTRHNMTYVRLPGSDTVYRIKGSHRPTFNKSVKNLRDKTVIKLDRDTVTKVAFVNEHGELKIERVGEGEEAAFQPVGVEIQNFNARKAKSIAGSLTGLSARLFVDEDPGPEITGLGPDAPKVVFEASKDGKPGTYTLWIGKEKEEDRQTHVKTSISDQIFLVSSHMIKRYQAKADDFARTDDEVVQETERMKKAEEHRAMHEAGKGPMPPAMSGQPGGQQIPPHIMKQIQEQMAKQPPAGAPPKKDDHDHGHGAEKKQ